MPKKDWKRINKRNVRHRTEDANIAIYPDGILLFVGNEPVHELMPKVSDAIKYYDEHIAKKR